MKASKFTGVQKVFIVKQGEEGTLVAEIFHKAGIRFSRPGRAAYDPERGPSVLL
jgi:hypothetical protein